MLAAALFGAGVAAGRVVLRRAGRRAAPSSASPSGTSPSPPGRAGPGSGSRTCSCAPSARGTGLGRALLQELARVCVERGYARFEWWVLDWNAPAIGFYRALGAVPQDEWTTFRVDGDALRALAARY